MVYNNWDIVDELPDESEWKLSAYGLDFGFVNDDTAMEHVVLAHGELWLDEEIYETGLLNTQIAERAKGAGLTDRQTIIADNAEMKSIAELNGLGLHVIPCVKGAGSIINGIDILKRYKLHITRRSVGIRREVVNYKWKIDKATGEPTNVPVDAFNHGLDAVRYVALKHLNVHKEARGITRRN